jgi:hypothetical protein
MHEIKHDAQTMGPTWSWSPAQKMLVRNLFQHRDLLRRLINYEFKSLDQARSTVIHVLNKMKRDTPNMFTAELGIHLYPRENKEGTWGIAPPLIGRRLDVNPFFIDGDIPLRRPQKNGEKWNLGEFIHNHPSRPTGLLPDLVHAMRTVGVMPALPAGFSLNDVLAALIFGVPLSVYHHSAAFRVSVKPEWFHLSDDVRMSRLHELIQWNKGKSDRSTQSIARLRAALRKLPIVFERVSPLIRDRGINARPIASKHAHGLGPNVHEILVRPWVPPPPSIFD